jgi:acetolactate synthase-1/2/3 large subunit
MIAYLADSISKSSSLKLINLKHEQHAGFAAEGVTRKFGIPAVALGTSGPGATNLITSIASCFFDSSPVIFITGQVNSAEIRTNPLQRQNGFQELEITALVAPIVKFSALILDPRDVQTVLTAAWNAATDGRPGPVLIDVPIDIQQMDALDIISGRSENPGTIHEPDPYLDLLFDLIEDSDSPLILAGAGIRLSKSVDEFRTFVDRWNIPVVWSLMAKDCLPTDHPLNFGMIGSYGNRCANRALSSSDLLIVLGSRLDIRQTGPSISEFARNKKIFRVDIDPAELAGRLKADYQIESGLNEFFSRANGHVIPFNSRPQQEIFQECQRINPVANEQELKSNLSPDQIMRDIASIETEAETYVVDVGQHQMWAAQSLPLREKQTFITSGGLGAMGFAIPAAIGIASISKSRVVVIVGDGGAQFSIAELETIKSLKLNIGIYILNNEQHGMVAQFQEEYLDSQFVGTRQGYSAPNFSAVAESFGIRSARVGGQARLVANNFPSTKDKKGATLVEIMVDHRFRALPKLGGKNPLSDL